MVSENCGGGKEAGGGFLGGALESSCSMRRWAALRLGEEGSGSMSGDWG